MENSPLEVVNRICQVDVVLFLHKDLYNYFMLKQRLLDDQITALKSGDKTKLELMRYILAQLHNKEIEKQAQLNDEDVVSLLKKNAKELQESIDAFEKGGRTDLVEQNQNQLKILKEYLPEEISDEQLEAELKKLIDKNQDLFQKNPKALTGISVKELKNKASPDRIIAVLKDKWQV